MRTSIAGALRASHGVIDPANPRTFYVCRDCLSRALPSAPISQRRRYARGKEPLTERLRKRIWGGEAPGPKNVYGEPQGVSTLLGSKQQQAESAQAQENDENLEVEEWDESGEAKGYYRPTSEALTQDQAKQEDEEYRPAETMADLRRIGDSTGWLAETDDAAKNFVTWRPKVSSESFTRPELFNLVRRAYIEATVLESEAPIENDVGNLPTSNYLAFHEAKVRVIDGRSELEALPSSWRENIVQQAAASVLEDEALESEAQEVEDTGEQVRQDITKPVVPEESEAAWQPWFYLPLESLTLKFAVIKRLSQLSGARIPDATINELSNLGDLFRAVQRREPAKTTYDILQAKPDLVDLPNVHIYSTRQTWVQKESSTGRYKSIVDALEEKGLPVPKIKGRRALN